MTRTRSAAAPSFKQLVKSIPPRQAAFLLDILQSVKTIHSYIAGLTHEQFLADTKTQDAVLRRFLVAGEAAARLTPETCAEFPNIPFHKIAGMRNRVVHDYGDIATGSRAISVQPRINAPDLADIAYPCQNRSLLWLTLLHLC